MSTPTIISVGHRCSCAGLLKELGYKQESYPFDWLISKLDVIQHCIENNFVEFMKKENYKVIMCNTINNTDNVITHLKEEGIYVNRFYQPEQSASKSTFHLRLGINHYDIFSDHGRSYYQRCIHRFKTKMLSTDKKILLYFHPIIGSNEFQNNYDSIRDLIIHFFDFIQGTYKNVYGLFIILVKCEKVDLKILYKLPDIIIYKVVKDHYNNPDTY